MPEQRGDTMTEIGPTADQPNATRVFNEHRNLLIAVAYRILGQVSDAEDVVQEAWLRWANVRLSEVLDPRAFLVRVTTRLAIDRLRRLKARRESYVGPWLPEPLLTGREELAAEGAQLAESLSMAMLIVLETLSPLERAVFVLREAFGMAYGEISEILGRSEPAVRQLAHRAREHVQERSTRFEADQATRQEVTERFLEATSNGDLEALLGVLAPGVRLVGDGGGRVRAPLRPIYGAEKVARFLVAISTEERVAKFLEAISTEPLPGLLRTRIAQVNGGPGIVVTYEGTPVTTIVLDVAEGVVQTIHLVANPEKLVGVSAIETF
jgi:RNA polymerase sigma-70 factor (TIGR02957 family)